MRIVKAVGAAALLACGATLVLAQTTTPPTVTTPSDSPSKAEPGAPDQGPGKQAPKGSGGAAIGPPAEGTAPTPGNNPAGVTKEKRKSNQDDPLHGGKKQ